jgi:hypothetical protein
MNLARWLIKTTHGALIALLMLGSLLSGALEASAVGEHPPRTFPREETFRNFSRPDPGREAHLATAMYGYLRGQSAIWRWWSALPTGLQAAGLVAGWSLLVLGILALIAARPSSAAVGLVSSAAGRRVARRREAVSNRDRDQPIER